MKKIIKWLLWANFIIAILIGIKWYIEKLNTHQGYLFDQRKQFMDQFKND